jgi:hypothetical protein
VLLHRKWDERDKRTRYTDCHYSKDLRIFKWDRQREVYYPLIQEEIEMYMDADAS